jgi:hypothetical protein
MLITQHFENISNRMYSSDKLADKRKNQKEYDFLFITTGFRNTAEVLLPD